MAPKEKDFDVTKLYIPFLYSLVMLNLLLLPGKVFSKAVSMVPSEMSGVPIDLIVHTVLFAGLVVSWSFARFPLRRVYILTLFVAAVSEIAQSFFSRTPSIEDFTANIIGASLGVAICWCARGRTPDLSKFYLKKR